MISYVSHLTHNISFFWTYQFNSIHILINQWTCTVESLINFGTECGLFGTPLGSVTTLAAAAITIRANSMKPSTVYAFKVVVSARDRRSATQTVTLSAVGAGSAQVSITSTFVRFNAGSTLTILGNLSATFDVNAQWDVRSSSDLSVPFSALTPTVRNISLANASKRLRSLSRCQLVGICLRPAQDTPSD